MGVTINNDGKVGGKGPNAGAAFSFPLFSDDEAGSGIEHALAFLASDDGAEYRADDQSPADALLSLVNRQIKTDRRNAAAAAGVSTGSGIGKVMKGLRALPADKRAAAVDAMRDQLAALGIDVDTLE